MNKIIIKIIITERPLTNLTSNYKINNSEKRATIKRSLEFRLPHNLCLKLVDSRNNTESKVHFAMKEHI